MYHGETQTELDLGESPDFWALSEMELAESCRLIAEGRCSRARISQRAEAMRVWMVWRDHLTPRRTREEAEERAAILAALRRRTIQMLVKLSITGRRVIPAR